MSIDFLSSGDETAYTSKLPQNTSIEVKVLVKISKTKPASLLVIKS